MLLRLSVRPVQSQIELMQADKESIKSTGIYFTPAPPVRCSTFQCFYIYQCANRTGLVEKSADFLLNSRQQGQQ